MKKNPEHIEADKALVDIHDDALGVSGLAERIATSIIQRTAPDGLVIGLYGAWGAGKTTFINFIEQSIRKAKQEDRPIIMRFNPWLFSGREDLIQRYLIELSKTLAPKDSERLQKRKNFVKGVENLSAVSEQLLLFASALQANPLLTGGVKALGALSRRAIKQLTKQDGLSEQKDRIEALLTGAGKKVLIIIDDIDRLESEEILAIFRMVKSVADFPNVVYLLSFDKPLVCSLINSHCGFDGKAYLEKIIQYDIDLPPADSQGILKLFGSRIDPTIEKAGGKAWDQERWGDFYRKYLRKMMKTPRQAIRLGNAFNLSYPALRGEVDPVDFLAVESLRMFDPALFEIIRRSPEGFTELGQKEFAPEKTDPIFFKKALESLAAERQETAKELLQLLFPRVENAFSNFKTSTDYISEWRSQGRVCSSYHFPRYFSYSLASGQFSDAEIESAIEDSADQKKFEALITKSKEAIQENGRSRIPELLERILDYVKADKASSRLQQLLRCFVILGDDAIREDDEDRGGFVRISADMRILWIIHGAMEKIEQEKIFEILVAAYKETKSLYIPLRLLVYLGHEHGLYGSKEARVLRYNRGPYLSSEQISELGNIILAKVSNASTKDSFLDWPNLHSLLYRWRDIANSFDGPRAWTQQVIKTDESLEKLLVRLSSISVISNAKGVTEKIRVDADSVQNFLDLEQTHRRVSAFLQKKISDTKIKTVLEAFEESYRDQMQRKESDKTASKGL